MADTAAHLVLIQDMNHREVIKQLHLRLSAIETVDPSQLVLQTLPTHLDANHQRLTTLGTPTDMQDLVTLKHANAHISVSVQELFKRLKIGPGL
jgi:hypothetical protein